MMRRGRRTFGAIVGLRVGVLGAGVNRIDPGAGGEDRYSRVWA